MKRYVFVIGMLTVLALAGCKDNKEEIPIATNSSSQLDDEDPTDELEDELPGEDIPDYSVDLPEKLSSFTIAIWGEVYKIPISYEEFTALGWTYKGKETAQLGPESYVENEQFEQEGNVVYVDLMNLDTESQPVSQCYIAGIHVDASSAESQGIHINLPGGIVFQKSTEEEVIAAYGSPIDRYEEGKSILLTYEYGMNSRVKLSFDEETGVLMEISLQNFRNPEGEEDLENVSDAITPEVEAYKLPEAEGILLQDFIVQYDGVLYQLPAPVSCFLDHGWTLDEDGSDEAVKSGKYGYATLVRNEQKIYAVVYNYGTEATTIKNCFVTTLYGDLDTTKIQISIAGGITLGMREEEFLERVGDQKYEKTEDKDNGYDIYTFYIDDEQLDYTQVTVDKVLHLVRQIKVVHNQDAVEDSETKDGQDTLENPDTTNKPDTDSESTPNPDTTNN